MTDVSEPSGAPNPIDLAREANFRLGGLLVRPSSREMERGDWRELLEPRVMQVLVALAQAGGAVVSRDDLIALCWEGRVVGEDAINRAIGRLRRLSETDNGESFAIETIPRVGYRLTRRDPLPASGSGQQVVAPALTGAPGPSGPKPTPRRLAIILSLAVALIGAGSAAAWWLTRPAEWTIDTFKVVVSTPAYENHPALAPNGAMIAYADGPAPYAWHIFIRNLSNGEPIQLTNGPGDDDMYPAWSPQSDRIAFARHREGVPCTIIIKPVPAGDERIVGHCREDDFMPPAWSPDGNALYFADRPTSRAARRILRLDLASGAVQAVTHPDDDTAGDRDPVPSPDGKKLTFVRRAKGIVTHLVLDLASGELTTLPDVASLNFNKAWIDNDTLIASSGGLTEPALWILPLGGTPKRLAANSQELDRISAGAGGQFAVETWRNEIVLASPPEKDGDSPAVLQATTGVSILPQYSADGRLAFVHFSQGGLGEIWIQRPGDQPHQMGALAATFLNGLRWAPDGKRLAFYGVIGKEHGIYVLNADGTGLRRLEQRGTIGMPAWTADSQGLILPMKDNTGWRLWRMPLDRPDHPVPISGYGWFAVVTSGEAIYALGGRGQGIWRLDGQPKFIANIRKRCTDAFVECQAWVVSGDTLIFADHNERAKPRIVLHSLTDGSERMVVAPALSSSDEIARDPITGKLIYVYDGLGDADIALFHLTRK